MKAKELLVSAGSLLLAGLILVVAGNALAPARGRKRRSGATGDDGDPASRKHGLPPRKRTRGPMPILRPSGKGKAAGS